MDEIISFERLKKYFGRDEFARFIGCDIVAAGEGRATVRMEIKPHHLNGVGLLHGGAVFTAADLAAAVAANSRGLVAVAVSCTVIYMKPSKGRTILATAREVSRGRTISNYAVDVVDEDSGDAVSSFQSTYFITGKDIAYFETRKQGTSK